MVYDSTKHPFLHPRGPISPAPPNRRQSRWAASAPKGRRTGARPKGWLRRARGPRGGCAGRTAQGMIAPGARPKGWLRWARGPGDGCVGCAARGMVASDARPKRWLRWAHGPGDDCAGRAAQGVVALGARPRGWLRRMRGPWDGCVGCAARGMVALGARPPANWQSRIPVRAASIQRSSFSLRLPLHSGGLPPASFAPGGSRGAAAQAPEGGGRKTPSPPFWAEKCRQPPANAPLDAPPIAA